MAEPNSTTNHLIQLERATRVMEYATIGDRRLRRHRVAVKNGDTAWWAEDERTAPSVFCGCSNETFRIRYEGDMCIGQCVACGKETTMSEGSY